jgi:shikimate kinase
VKLFLIGMMGSGKTYWASKLAKKLKTTAYDLDRLIENLEDKTVAEIFEQDGEAYFRKVESKILRWFGEKKSFVLATGGGTSCFNGNMEWMNANGTTLWLNDAIPAIVERLSMNKDKRPKLNNLTDNQLGAFVENLLKERLAYYHKAQLVYHGTPKTEKDLLQLIQPIVP